MRWKETDQESRKDELGRDIAWVAPVLLQDSLQNHPELHHPCRALVMIDDEAF